MPLAAAHDAPAKPEDAVEVGRVLGPWGVKGGIKVKPFSADPQALFSSKRWFVEPSTLVVQRPAGAAVAAPLPKLLRVISAREQGDAVVATTQEVSDRDAAQALTGARIFVSRSSFPTTYSAKPTSSPSWCRRPNVRAARIAAATSSSPSTRTTPRTWMMRSA
jgi:hypothetical protein